MIVAGIAALPERAASLRKTIGSLLPQVDGIYLYLNGWSSVPGWLDHSQIIVARSQQDRGDLGDAGKFRFVDWARHDYFLACDDDLVYPPTYAKTVKAAIKRHDKKAVVGYHGRVLAPNGGQRVKYHCLNPLLAEQPVHVLGTGCLGFHADAIRLVFDYFPTPNMADVWFAVEAKKQGVPMFVLPHDRSFLTHTHHDRTIWSEGAAGTGSFMDTAAVQSDVLRKNAPWPVLA